MKYHKFIRNPTITPGWSIMKDVFHLATILLSTGNRVLQMIYYYA
jgi:hypothetical protein